MTETNTLQWYTSHKRVQAAKITSVSEVGDADRSYYLRTESGVSIRVSDAFVVRHKPAPGGYYVRYKDGYESFSPAEAFEEGYTLGTASRLPDDVRAVLILAQSALDSVNEPIDNDALHGVNAVLEADRVLRATVSLEPDEARKRVDVQAAIKARVQRFRAQALEDPLGAGQSRELELADALDQIAMPVWINGVLQVSE